MANYKIILKYIFLALLVVYFLDAATYVTYAVGGQVSDFHFKNIAFAYIAAYFLVLSLLYFLPQRIFKIVIIILSVPITFAYAFILGHLVYFSSPITNGIMLTILDTNFNETSEFIETLFGIKTLYVAVIMMVPYVLIYLLGSLKEIRSTLSLKIIIPMLVLAAVIISFTYDKRWVKREISFLMLIDTYTQTKKDKQAFFLLLEERDKNKYVFDNITFLFDKNNSQTFVVVIGESHNRRHSSVYGYNRETMPSMSALKDDLFVFDDVVSPNVITNITMQKVITFADNRNPENAYKYGSIIDFFQSAGFKTFWLSNQYYLGNNDSLYAAMAYRADTAVFLNEISGFFLETPNYDDKLLESFDEAMKDKAKYKIIFVHLMGSHTPYERRYPKDFGSFKDYGIGFYDVLGGVSKQKTIDTYDNSIEFTDSLLGKIVEKLEAAKNSSFMLYFPDHGIDVYDEYPDKNLPRDENNPTRAMFEIPFILWLSDNYRKENADFIRNFDNFTSRPYQTDRVTHSILDLARLKQSILNYEDSIFSGKFKEKERTISGKVYNGPKNQE